MTSGKHAFLRKLYISGKSLMKPLLSLEDALMLI